MAHCRQKQQSRQASESNGNPGKRLLCGGGQCSSDITEQNASQLSPSRNRQPQDSRTTRLKADTGEGAAEKGARGWRALRAGESTLGSNERVVSSGVTGSTGSGIGVSPTGKDSEP